MRKHYSEAFKNKIVSEILNEKKTIAQISTEYESHPIQLYKWKNTLPKNNQVKF